jgi:hypothetical protein
VAHSQEEWREAAESGNVDPELLAFLPIIASRPSLLFLEVPVQLSAVDQCGDDDSGAIGSISVSAPSGDFAQGRRTYRYAKPIFRSFRPYVSFKAVEYKTLSGVSERVFNLGSRQWGIADHPQYAVKLEI